MPVLETIAVLRILAVITKVNVLENALQVIWSDNSDSLFPFIWLRDTDPLGFHPQTHERLFDLTSIDIDIKPHCVSLTDQGVELQWPNEQQSSVFSLEHLANYAAQCKLQDPAQVTYQSWQQDFSPQVFDSKECQNPADLQRLFLCLKKHGLVIISGLEGTHGGEQFGDLVGFKRETNFGVMFEVINKADPNNLAYTAVELPLHTDLSNQQSPPGYQFLHCIENGAQGGESVLADGFAISEELKRSAPQDFERLCRGEMPFRFHDTQCDIRFSHPLISEQDGKISCFIFNAHLADSYPLAANDCIAYYRAYQRLMVEIRKEKYAKTLKLKAGEMIIFDNKRVLHGRNSFDPATGNRHLRGFYIDHGEVDSKIRLLSRSISNE